MMMAVVMPGVTVVVAFVAVVMIAVIVVMMKQTQGTTP
jgi:hypothetical protein